jgi:hypothetical protein
MMPQAQVRGWLEAGGLGRLPQSAAVMGSREIAVLIVKVLAAERVRQSDDGIVGPLHGSVSTCTGWRIPVVVGTLLLVLGEMQRDAVPGMSINGRQALV